MRALLWLCALAAAAVAAVGAASATAQPAVHTFVAPMTAAQEVPPCAQATSAARGVAILRVTDPAAGTVEYRLIATKLPGMVIAAHIHIGQAGVAGPVVQPLSVNVGSDHGVVGEGSFTNSDLLAVIRQDPSNFYVNVHTDVCPAGAIRGQLGVHAAHP